MSVMIWDSASQAFSETTEVPKRFDAESGAWVETTGMAYDDEAGAWTEMWSNDNKIYLYKDGNEYEYITGGWNTEGWTCSTWSVGAIKSYNDGNMRVTAKSSSTRFPMCGSSQKIDFTNYSKIHYEIKTMSGYMQVGMFLVTEKSLRTMIGSYHNSIGEYEIDISNTNGSFYIVYICSNDYYVNSYSEFNNLWLE